MGEVARLVTSLDAVKTIFTALSAVCEWQDDGEGEPNDAQSNEQIVDA